MSAPKAIGDAGMAMRAETIDFAFRSTARSHVGVVRTLNEDSFVTRDDIGLWAVADGVGGHDAGDAASRMLMEALARFEAPASGRAFFEGVRTEILSVNSQIIQHVKTTPGVRSMGTTIVCMIVYRDHFACFWAGDSRCYRLRDGIFDQLTHDHSLVAQLVRAGDITEEAARTHPQRNVITRAVGFSETLEVDVVRAPVAPGDRFLLCSDGLTGPLEDREIAEHLREADIAAASDKMLALALERGARDNVTFVVVDTFE